MLASNIIFEPKEKFKSYCAGNISNQYKNWKTITSDIYIRGIVKRGLILSFNKDKFNNFVNTLGQKIYLISKTHFITSNI